MSEVPYSSRAADKFMVRLPDGMREQIAEAAKGSNRSMNAETVVAIQRHLGTEVPEPGQLTMQERDLLDRFRKIGPTGRNIVLAMVCLAAKNEQ